MIANTLPSNGNCYVTPQSGASLIDVFNFSCVGWNDIEGHSIEYNFIKQDSNTFLNTYLPFGTEIQY